MQYYNFISNNALSLILNTIRKPRIFIGRGPLQAAYVTNDVGGAGLGEAEGNRESQARGEARGKARRKRGESIQ